MKKTLVVLSVLSSFMMASQVEITADKFFGDEQKKISIFEGNVKIVRENGDKLTAKKVTIDFDEKKQPLRYIATGDAKGNMLMNQKKYYGEAEKMTYEPNKNLYTLEKKAFLHELDTDKKVYGDFIRVDQNSGHYEVDGKGSAPVKFIFKVDDKQDKPVKKEKQDKVETQENPDQAENQDKQETQDTQEKPAKQGKRK